MGPGEFVSQDTLVAILNGTDLPGTKVSVRSAKAEFWLRLYADIIVRLCQNLCSNEALPKFYLTLDFNKILICQM